jgi:hypothetical protein
LRGYLQLPLIAQEGYILFGVHQRRLGFHPFGGTMPMTTMYPFCEAKKARLVSVLNLAV